MGHMGKNLTKVIHNKFLIILEYIHIGDLHVFVQFGNKGWGTLPKDDLYTKGEEMISDCLMIGFLSLLANKDPNSLNQRNCSQENGASNR